MLNERIGPETARFAVWGSPCRIHGRLTSTIRCLTRRGLTRSICLSLFRRNASVR